MRTIYINKLKYCGIICRNYSALNYNGLFGNNNSLFVNRNSPIDIELLNRRYSTLQLMQFPEIVWPSVFKSIKNWILVNLIIRPYFDNDFTLNGFSNAAKQALQLVSSKISSGEINTLDGLVTADSIAMLQKSVSLMSVAQRSDLRVIKDDIYFSFPYQVGIMFDDNEEVQKRWVEITMVFHVLRGLKDMQDRNEPPPINLGVLPEFKDKISICNYRFIKEFTQGNEGDWIINIVNHFKPGDFVNE